MANERPNNAGSPRAQLNAADVPEPSLGTATVPSQSICLYLTIFVIASAVRAIYLWEIGDLVFVRTLVGDAAGYDRWAWGLVTRGWRAEDSFYQAPLYPYFLSIIYEFAGHSPQTVRVVQCILGSIGCVLVAAVGTRFFDRQSGRWAGILLAFFPIAVYYDCTLQKTSLGLFLLCGLLWVLTYAGQTGSPAYFVGLGAATGLLALVRENALALAPVVFVYVALTQSNPRRGAPGHLNDSGNLASSGSDATPFMRRRAVAVMSCIAGLMVVLSPVAIHNYRTAGAVSITTFQLGPNFYMGNHAGADGRYAPLIPGRETFEFERSDATALAERAAGRRLSPPEVSSYWLGQALDFVGRHPIDWLALQLTKWRLVWNRYEIPDTESYYVYCDASALASVVGAVLHFGTLCPLAVVGVVLTRSRRRALWILYALAIVFASAVAAFYVFGRYRFPLVGILVLFAGAGIMELTRRAKARDYRNLVAALLIGGVSALWVNWPVNPERELNAAQLGNLGATFAATGQYDDAVTYIRRAVDILPDAPRLRQFLADALSIAQRYDEAIPHYRKLLDLEPEWPNARFNFAVALENVGDTDEALRQYRLAVRHDPTDAEARAAVQRLADSTSEH